MKLWFVYILTNHTNSVLYIGITNNLEKRIFEHKSMTPGSFTARYKIYKLVWFQEFQTPEEAIENEKRLKGWRREKKINLIKSINPNFKNLYSES